MFALGVRSLRYELFAGFAALVYPFGIPAFYAWKLVKARERLDPGVGQKQLVNTKVVRCVVDEVEGKDGVIH